MPPSTAAASPCEKPCCDSRKSTTKPVTAICVRISSALAFESRQIRRSRSGWRSASDSSSMSRTGPSSISAAAATAAASENPASASSPPRDPQSSEIGGSANEAITPPSGTAVWRTASAKPRSERGNQLVTARPVAVFVLAPNAPARNSSANSDANPGAYAAQARPPAEPSSPTVAVTRSPMRSAARPQASMVNSAPTPVPPSRTPIWVRLRS